MWLYPPITLPHLAMRIEQAYRRRYRALVTAPEETAVWTAAAERLVDLHASDPGLPLDPELYVASQIPGRTPDPWSDLASACAGRRYRRRVRRMIARLRRELRRELRFATQLGDRGQDLESVVRFPSPYISPITRYVLAIHAERPDLAQSLIPEVRAQHHACPLYRQAAARFLPPMSYPIATEGSHPTGSGVGAALLPPVNVLLN